MATYARIQNGIVFELITPPSDESGQPMPMGDLYNPALIDGSISYMVDVSSVTPQPQQEWTAVQNNSTWTFSPPVPV